MYIMYYDITLIFLSPYSSRIVAQISNIMEDFYDQQSYQVSGTPSLHLVNNPSNSILH